MKTVKIKQGDNEFVITENGGVVKLTFTESENKPDNVGVVISALNILFDIEFTYK